MAMQPRPPGRPPQRGAAPPPRPPGRPARPPGRAPAPQAPARPAARQQAQGQRRPPANVNQGYVFVPRDPNSVKQRSERRGGRFDSHIKDGFDQWKAKAGNNTVRILPPTWDGHEGHYSYPVWMHKYVGPDNSSYICPRKMFGDPCAVCDEERASREAGDTEQAKQLMPRENWICWVIDRAEDPQSPFIWTMSQPMDANLAALAQNTDGSIIEPHHPDVGYDLSLIRTGVGLKTQYSGERFARDPSPINPNPAIQASVMQFIIANPIPDVLNVYDNDYLTQMISGTAPEAETVADDQGQDDAYADGRYDPQTGEVLPEHDPGTPQYRQPAQRGRVAAAQPQYEEAEDYGQDDTAYDQGAEYNQDTGDEAPWDENQDVAYNDGAGNGYEEPPPQRRAPPPRGQPRPAAAAPQRQAPRQAPASAPVRQGTRQGVRRPVQPR